MLAARIAGLIELRFCPCHSVRRSVPCHNIPLAPPPTERPRKRKRLPSKKFPATHTQPSRHAHGTLTQGLKKELPTPRLERPAHS